MKYRCFRDERMSVLYGFVFMLCYGHVTSGIVRGRRTVHQNTSDTSDYFQDIRNVQNVSDFDDRLRNENLLPWGDSRVFHAGIHKAKEVEDPKINTKPDSNVKFFVGDAISLEVSFSGDPIEEIKWTLKDVPVEDGDQRIVIVNGKSSSTLKIANALQTDSGKYVCTVRGRNKGVTMETNVNVKEVEDPQINIKPDRNINSFVGDRMSLEVSFSGDPIEEIKWTVKDVPVEDGDERIDIVKGESSSTLKIANALQTDSGKYACTVRGRNKGVTMETNVNVKDAEVPKIITELDPYMTVFIGGGISLEVAFTGGPITAIIWSKNGMVFQGGDPRVVIEKRRESSRLTLKDANLSDAGTYDCTIYGRIGSASSRTHLIVKEAIKPAFTGLLQPITEIKIGRNITLQVSFVDALGPRTKWTKDGKEIYEDDRVKIERLEGISRLSINSVQKSDRGTYECTIFNEEDESATSTTRLFVKDLIRPKFTKPLQPTTEVPIGRDIFLEVSFTYAESHRTKWTRDGKEIKEDGSRIKIETSEGVSRLTIISAEVVDAGTYECIISSVDETVWTTTVLSVIESNVLDCKENPCQNGGHCVIKDGRSESECICTQGFTGNRCQIEILCRPNPCMNDGRCLVDCKEKKYSCQCTDDYTGTFCETAQVCRSNPCQNGGSCILDKETKSYACLCKDGYVGKECEVEVVCSPNPCLNGGRCLLDCDSGQYACLCSEDYSGKHCENAAKPQ